MRMPPTTNAMPVVVVIASAKRRSDSPYRCLHTVSFQRIMYCAYGMRNMMTSVLAAMHAAPNQVLIAHPPHPLPEGFDKRFGT